MYFDPSYGLTMGALAIMLIVIALFIIYFGPDE